MLQTLFSHLRSKTVARVGTRVSRAPQLLLEQKEKLLDLIMHAGASGGEVYAIGHARATRGLPISVFADLSPSLSLPARESCKEDVFRLGS
jgi:hypothetical protein